MSTMKLMMIMLVLPLTLLANTVSQTGRTWYVNAGTGSDSNSGFSAGAAKATIQAAVDASSEGDTILVAPGTYAPIVTENKAITIRSMSGASNTIIDGEGKSVRCVNAKPIDYPGCDHSTILTNTVIVGFTLQNGNIGLNYGVADGGCAIGGIYKNCILRNGVASGGGNVADAVVENCLILNGHGYNGGNVICCIVRNCTIIGGRAEHTAEACYNCAIYNSICYNGSCCNIGSWDWGALVELEAGRHENVCTDDPNFIDAANGDYRLAAGSPCIDAGSNSYVTTPSDLAGNARIANGTVDIGCYEYGSSPLKTTVTNGLVAWYKFDGNANDSSGNSNHGVICGVELTEDRFGNSDSAYLFNGADYIQIPTSSQLDAIVDFSICAWIKVNAWYSSWIPIMSKGTGVSDTRQYGLEIVKKGYLSGYDYNSCFEIIRGSNDDENGYILTDYEISLNSWIHVAVTRDGEITRAFLNGMEIGRIPSVKAVFNTENIDIGRDLPGASEYFNGSMDDIRIYNRALSANEIRSLYAGTSEITPVTYTITLDANGGMCPTNSIVYNQGASYGILPTPTRTGYTFTGWFTSASGGNEVTSSTTATANTTIYAQWRINSYTITLNANGGNCSSGSIMRNYGVAYGTLPTPTRTGYTFIGWFTSASGGNEVTSTTTATSNTTIYAQWQINSYTITFNANGGSCSSDSITRNYGVEYGTLPIPTRTGYTFTGWFTSASGGNEVTSSTTVTANTTIYAQWERIPDPTEMGVGLVARYKFDGNANDLSGNGYNLNNDGAQLTIDRMGNKSSAYAFDGVDATLYIPHDRNLVVSNNFTLSIWAKTDEEITLYGESSWGTCYDNKYLIYPTQVYNCLNLPNAESGAGIGLAVGANGVAVYEHTSNHLPVLLEHVARIGSGWNHYVVTISNNGAPVLYINGEYVRTGVNSSYPKIFAMAYEYVREGESGIGGGYYGRFCGSADEFRVYNRALSAAEIRSLYNDDAAVMIPTTDVWTVTQYNLKSRPLSISDAEIYLEDSSIWDGEPATKTYQTISFGDNLCDDLPNFNTVSFPGNYSEKSDWFIVEATGRVHVSEAGYWTFACGADNGFRVNISGNGVNWVFSGGNYYGYGIGVDTIYLPVEGEYEVRLLYYEDGGQAILDFSTAKGSYSSFDSSIFKLVGDPASGVTMAGDSTITEGLAISYYDAGNSDTLDLIDIDDASYEETVAFFQSRTPNLVTNTCDIGEVLDFGYHWNSDGVSRFHSEYADYNTHYFWAFMTGKIILNETGSYKFGLKCDDGCNVFIDGKSVINTQAYSSHTYKEAEVYLTSGVHSIVISYSEYNGPQGLSLYMKRPSEESVSLLSQFILDAGDVKVGVYAITLDANGGTCSTNSIVCNQGASYGTLPTPTRTGYTFIGWFTSASGGNEVTSSTTATANTTIYAQWQINSYTITFNANGGNCSSGSIMRNYGVEYGALPTPTRTGYTFIGWFTSASGGSQVTSSTTATANTTIYAQWRINSYTITLNANGGSCSSGSITRNYGVEYGALPTPTRTGYTFTGWFTSASGGTQVTSSTTTTSNTTIYAQWRQSSFQITFDANGGEGGGVRTYNYGVQIGNYPVPNMAGYEFLGWYTSPVGGTQISQGMTVTANATYYAQWELLGLYDPPVWSEDGEVDWSESEEDPFAAEAAATFDGYILDSEEVVGFINVKAAKKNKRSGISTIKATVTMLGVSKKLSYKGDMLPNGYVLLKCAKQPDMTLVLGTDAMWGELDGKEISGARNVFAKPTAETTDILNRFKGVYSLVLETVDAEGDGYYSAFGYSILSIDIGSKGKVKIKGTMTDGSKVTFTSQLIVGETACCIPVVSQLYSKKGGFAFNIWLYDDGSAEIAEVSTWDAMASSNPFIAWWAEDVIFAKVGGTLPEKLCFMSDIDFNVDGVELIYDYLPYEVMFETGSKWKFPKSDKLVWDKDEEFFLPKNDNWDNVSGLKLTYVKKSGEFKGSFYVYCVTESMKLKKYTAKVTGTMVGSVGYGTATIKGIGSWTIKIE